MTNESAGRRCPHQQFVRAIMGGRPGRIARQARNEPASIGRSLRGLAVVGIAGVTLGLTSLLAVAPVRSATNDIAATIKFADHHWDPLNVQVPADQPLELRVVNASNETIEFESFKLNRETAMTPGQTITVKLPALSAGSYDFYDDFHQDVPEGTIVAK
jgi:Cupredoxin-like domain